MLPEEILESYCRTMAYQPLCHVELSSIAAAFAAFLSVNLEMDLRKSVL